MAAFDVEGTPIVSRVLGPGEFAQLCDILEKEGKRQRTGSILRSLRSADLGYIRSIEWLLLCIGVADVGDQF